MPSNWELYCIIMGIGWKELQVCWRSLLDGAGRAADKAHCPASGDM